MKTIKGKQFFSSWSGGKDSCLALYKAFKQGGSPRCLFTMFADDNNRSRSHGLSPEIIEAQSKALAIPSRIAAAAWADYEGVFLENIAYFKAEGLFDGVFGDIDLEPHRDWVERVCAKQEVTSHLPLWKSERRELDHHAQRLLKKYFYRKDPIK